MIATTRSEMSVSEPTLCVAFELSKQTWKLAMTSGFGVPPLLRTVGNGDWAAVERALARRGVRARVSEPAADRRAPGICADALCERGASARARDQPGRQRAAAIDDDSARVAMGAMATEQSDHAVVRAALWVEKARPQNRDCGGGAQAADCAVAMGDGGGRTRRRLLQGRVSASATNVSHACRVYGLWRVRRAAHRHREGTATTVSGSRLHSLRGPRHQACARIEGDAGSGIQRAPDSAWRARANMRMAYDRWRGSCSARAATSVHTP